MTKESVLKRLPRFAARSHPRRMAYVSVFHAYVRTRRDVVSFWPKFKLDMTYKEENVCRAQANRCYRSTVRSLFLVFLVKGG